MRSFAAFTLLACAGFAACSGNSSDDATADGASTPSACARFQAAQSLQDACDALGGGCPEALYVYLASGHVAPKSYARVGCGLTEIHDVNASGNQTNAYVFDGTGALVGFDRTYKDDSALCGTGEYTFGALLDDCDAVRECHIPKDAAETGEVCGCTCPEPPPEDGVFSTTADCVYPAHPIEDCQRSLDVQLTDGSILRYGCGFYVTGDPSGVMCTYDPAGVLVGSSREDAASQTCAGVTLLQTGEPYVTCDAEQTCVWDLGGLATVADPAAASLTSCGLSAPDAGGPVSCSDWKNEADVSASCELIAEPLGQSCPADERSFLAGFDDPTLFKAVVGCGITWYQPTGPGVTIGGSAFAFDTGGNLVGYAVWRDAPFGPCLDRFDYERGDQLMNCAVVESCDLRADRTPSCR